MRKDMKKWNTTAVVPVDCCFRQYLWDYGTISDPMGILTICWTCVTPLLTTVSHILIWRTTTDRYTVRQKKISDVSWKRIWVCTGMNWWFPRRPVMICGPDLTVTGAVKSTWWPAWIRAWSVWDWIMWISSTITDRIQIHRWRRPFVHWTALWNPVRHCMWEFPITIKNRPLQRQNCSRNWAHRLLSTRENIPCL